MGPGVEFLHFRDVLRQYYISLCYLGPFLFELRAFYVSAFMLYWRKRCSRVKFSVVRRLSNLDA